MGVIQAEFEEGTSCEERGVLALLGGAIAPFSILRSLYYP